VRFGAIRAQRKSFFELNESVVESPLSLQDAAQAEVVCSLFGINRDRLAYPLKGALEIAGLPGNEPEPMQALRMHGICGEYPLIQLLRFIQAPPVMVSNGFLQQALNLR